MPFVVNCRSSKHELQPTTQFLTCIVLRGIEPTRRVFSASSVFQESTFEEDRNVVRLVVGSWSLIGYYKDYGGRWNKRRYVQAGTGSRGNDSGGRFVFVWALELFGGGSGGTAGMIIAMPWTRSRLRGSPAIKHKTFMLLFEVYTAICNACNTILLVHNLQ